MTGAQDRQQYRMESLIAETDQCGLYGRRYNESETLEELFTWLGEAVCITAFRIVRLVKPRRIEKWAKLYRWLAGARYDAFIQMRVNLFATAVFYVADMLREAFRSWARVPYPEMLADQSIFKGAETFSKITGMSEEEKKNFFAAMSSKMILHLDNPPQNTTDALRRILAETGKDTDEKQIARLLASEAVRDPLRLIEPHEFASRFQRLLQ